MAEAVSAGADAPLLAVPYLRVSTDDKGQNPQRQLDLIRAWAAREGVTLLREYVDEGTSATKTNPFQRPKFVQACEAAHAAGASAIVVEIVDRFCGQGSDEFGWAKVEMRGRYGLQLWTADVPLSMHGTLGGNVMAAAKAEVRREWAALHSRRVKTGMLTNGPTCECGRSPADHLSGLGCEDYRPAERKSGWGAPPKPLSDEEIELALKLYRPPGRGRFGWRRVAHAINKARGALDVYDPRERRKRSVSHNHVKRIVAPLLDKKKNGQKGEKGAGN